MITNKRVEIACQGAAELELDRFENFQGKLKDLPKENYEKLKKEILELGFSEPVSVWHTDDNHHYILNGHQRVTALRRMKREGFEVPAFIPINLIRAKSLAEAKRKILSLTSQFGKITPQGLYDFMADSDIRFEELESSFVLPEIDLPSFRDDFFSGNQTSDPEKDEQTPDSLPIAIVKRGEIFELGTHRLICGDAMDRKTVELLLGSARADLVYTDPPYGIGYKSPSGHGLTVRGDYPVIEGDMQPFEPQHLLGWAEKIVTWGANHYADKLPSQAAWLVWDKREGDAINKNSDCELAWSNVGGSARLFHHKWNGMIKASERTEKRVHPTQKPVLLAEWAFKIVDAGQNVLDLFGGSGSTMIACEKTARHCFMAEIDAIYCQVIIDRWCQFTGKEAYRLDEKYDRTPWSKIKAQAIEDHTASLRDVVENATALKPPFEVI